MSEFFQSEIIQEELDEINQLQEKIYGSLLSFSVMSQEQKLENIEILETLLEKQRGCILGYLFRMILKQFR